MPISKCVVAKPHTPQYRMHKYFARRPFNVFINLIEHYSKEGDIVLDCFCGGGVTVFESVALRRNAIGIDLNPLATMITEMQMFTGDIQLLRDIYSDFIQNLRNKYEYAYEVVINDDRGLIEWVEWAYQVVCPVCGSLIVLTEENKISNGIYKCSNENCIGIGGVKRIDCKPSGSTPIRIKYYSSTTKSFVTYTLNSDEKSIALDSTITNLLTADLSYPDFKIPLDWDRQLEDRLAERGVLEYRDFFTKRNFTVNALVFNEIMNLRRSGMDSQWVDYLYFLFSSSLRYTNNMSRVTDNWEGGNPTSYDKHAFWLPNQYIEVNVLNTLEKRAKAIIAGCEYSANTLPYNTRHISSINEIDRTSYSYLVLNQSSANLSFPNESVDVVITDPPYGSNVQYAELSMIWNAWYSLYKGIGSPVNNSQEAVVNRKLKKQKGAKSEADYEDILHQIFSECHRVLKQDGFLVFTFNNKNINVWLAMLKAVAKAGFILPEGGVVFQDFVNSYKNTSHLKYAGNVHGDFIYSFQKANIQNNQKKKPEISSLSDLIDNSVLKAIDSVFKNRESVTTTELHQEIFIDLARSLMEFVTSDRSSLKLDGKGIFSKDMVDIQLKKYLNYDDNMWSMKGQQ